METIDQLKAQLAQEIAKRQHAEGILKERGLALSQSNSELKELTKSLESRVEQRTAELRKARDEALKLAEVKSDFLANMSHELRTPLNGVLGMLALLKNTELDVKQIKLLSTAVNSGELLLALINDVLDLSKLEHDKLELENIAFDPTELIQLTCEPFASQAVTKGLELIYILAPDLPLHLKGDPIRFKQILTNLVSNALKFTEQGEILVSARYEKDEFILTVSDTGIGMTPEQVDKVMDKFSQANESTTRNFGGTGLGLTICQKLVDIMEGNIIISSEFGEGSSFEVRVPLTVQEGELELFYSTDLNDKNFILAFSNLHIGHYVESLLRFWNIQQIDMVFNVDDLLTKLQAEADYDVVILDQALLNFANGQVQNLVEKHHSQCHLISCWQAGENVQQEPNHSKIALPIKQSELFNTLIQMPEADLRRDYMEVLHQEKLDFNNAKILLAEDNLVNQQVAIELLKHYNCKVTVANNGVEAVSLVAKEDFELILMDIQMPQLDGMDATKKIRELGIRTPVVALTAHSLQGDREKSLKAGMDDHLTKPIELSALAKVLSKFLAVNSQRADAGVNSEEDDFFDCFIEDDLAVSNDLQAIESSNSNFMVLNTDAAMGRLLNDKGLYSRVLKEFLLSTDQEVENIKLGIAHKDLLLIANSCHTIKGTSANIGAEVVQQAAEDIECYVKNSSEQQQVITEVEHKLSQLLIAKECLYQKINDFLEQKVVNY